LPRQLGDLKNLRSLNLVRSLIVSIVSGAFLINFNFILIVGSFVRRFVSVQRNCKKLEILPISLGQLTKLDFLDISECVDLSIPKSLEMFKDISEGWDESKVE
jgi:hypothetical protein